VQTSTSLWSNFCGSGSSRNDCATTSISQPSQKPSRSKIRRIWRTSFYIDGFTTVRTVALRGLNFNWYKGFAIISLGLNYYRYSMCSSQPPTRDTVPLNWGFLTAQSNC
jgi:hypothetical protein